jgi:hypothetical protein
MLNFMPKFLSRRAINSLYCILIPIKSPKSIQTFINRVYIKEILDSEEMI